MKAAKEACEKNYIVNTSFEEPNIGVKDAVVGAPRAWYIPKYQPGGIPVPGWASDWGHHQGLEI